MTLLGAAVPLRAQQPGERAPVAADPAAMTGALDMTALQSSHPQLFAAIADRALGVAMKTAVVPSLFGQDARYVASTSCGALRRAGYAASRTVVVRGRLGQSQFNVSEIGGAGVSAALSNVYHSAADRTLGATLTRWGTQVLFDSLSNELKEFWPDIRRAFRR